MKLMIASFALVRRSLPLIDAPFPVKGHPLPFVVLPVTLVLAPITPDVPSFGVARPLSGVERPSFAHDLAASNDVDPCDSAEHAPLPGDDASRDERSPPHYDANSLESERARPTAHVHAMTTLFRELAATAPRGIYGPTADTPNSVPIPHAANALARPMVTISSADRRTFPVVRLAL